MKNTYYLLIFVLLNGLFFPGCKTGEKRQFTDWSIPTVRLTPHSKDEKIVPPAEKASPQATSSLAHDRLNGHNPTAAIRENSDDPTLRPNPQEVAQLNQFEGRQTPDWATSEGLPPGPEATSPVAAERVAQNVTDQTVTSTQAPQFASGVDGGLSPVAPSTTSQVQAGQPAPMGQVAPTASMGQAIPAVQAAQMAGGQVPPAASTSLYGDELPDSLDALPGSVPASPTVPATSAVQQAGAAMTELPETIPATAVVPGVQAQGGSSQTPAQAQPAVLFMPGNINPQYPQGPAGN